MLYLIKRGPRPDYHRAPYHPVLLCDNKPMAREEYGNTSDQATVWENNQPHKRDNALCHGWLLVRYKGLDIDYFPVISGPILFDGTPTGFYHDHQAEPWTLLQGAVWWSARPMPQALTLAGVIYPPDSFSRNRILDQATPLRGMLGPFEMTVQGTRREPLPWWTAPVDEWEPVEVQS